MTIARSLVLVFLVGACGSDGSAGPAGPGGADGMTGGSGEPGPITDPPALVSLSPDWGSANTHVTITGTGFSTTPTDNHVFFDGNAATVITATTTTLVVRPDVASNTREIVVVDVEVANQVSNGLVFELVASGTADQIDVVMPGNPTGVVAVGADIYFAAMGTGGNGNGGGLFKLSAGVVTRVIAPRVVSVPNGSGGTFELVDGPFAVATFGGNIYYTTMAGSVRRYTVATDTVTELLPAGPGQPNFPARTGLALDAGGDLYIVDRNLNLVAGTSGMIIRLRANNTAALITNPGALHGSTTAPGIYGITSDGTDLFVTNEVFNEVWRISNLAATPAFTLTSTSAFDVQGITTVGANVITSAADGGLETVAKTATNAAAAAFGEPLGYNYQASSLAMMGTDLLLAQPTGAAIRRKAAGGNPSSIIAAGVRPAFTTVQVGSTWYAATVGIGLFTTGPITGQPDTAIIEINSNGTSRVLANTMLGIGLVSSAAGELTASDCLEARVYTLTIATTTQTNRLISTDGVTCPSGLAIDGAGTLFYIDDPGAANEIGSLAGTTHNATFATGLPISAVSLAIAGGNLITSSLEDQPTEPMHKVSATAGGASTQLVSAFAVGAATVATAPDGTLFAMRSGSGDLVTIDPASGVITPFDTTVGQSFAFSIGFGADGTMTRLDLAQGGLVSIAP